jgi:uncharacterized protein (TIGR00299 family) protein
MAIAYFDCFCGVAGDMILGSLIDAGMPLSRLERELKKINVGGYRLKKLKPRGPAHIRGTNLHVETTREFGDTRFSAIAKLIERSKLKPYVKEMSVAIMERLAKAESRVHGVPLDKVHFHEIGMTDSIVDCVGAAIGFAYFGFESISSSPLPITRGRIKCAHGMLPVPAPATLELIKGMPIEPSPVCEEIVTPTGAAILSTAVSHFGSCPLQRIEKIGYGFGDRIIPEMPNALRLMIGEGFPVVMVEATIDDMNPQIFDYLMDRLFEGGAVDVTLAPVQMKKNRQGTIVSCQVPWDLKDDVIAILLRETTTTGVRYFPVERRVMMREMKTVKTKRGTVRVKVARDDDLGVVKEIPEYEDMKKLAVKNKIPLIEAYRWFNSKSKS